MEKLYIAPSESMPEITLSHDDNVFRIKGVSRPENVRLLYEPVVKWLSDYKEILINKDPVYSEDNPFILHFHCILINSSISFSLNLKPRIRLLFSMCLIWFTRLYSMNSSLIAGSFKFSIIFLIRS